MSSPTVSVIVSTYRPGGIDIVLAGMRDQTYRDFEFILVDRRFDRRADRVAALAKQYGVPLIHATEHRRNGKWVSFCSAWNTGMALARGDVLLFQQDWAYSPPGWIEAHLRALDGNRRYVLAPYSYGKLPELALTRPVAGSIQEQGEARCSETTRTCVEQDSLLEGGLIDEVSAFKQGLFDPAWIPEIPLQEWPHNDVRRADWGPLAGSRYFAWVHLKNESILRSVAWELNGLDERLERGKGPMDTDWEWRIRWAGLGLWWEPSAWSFCLNPRVLFFTQPWGSTFDRVEGRWSWEDGKAYVDRRKAEMANGGSTKAKNPYELADLAARLDPWRTGQERPSSIDVDDRTYWKQDIWPDTE